MERLIKIVKDLTKTDFYKGLFLEESTYRKNNNDHPKTSPKMIRLPGDVGTGKKIKVRFDKNKTSDIPWEEVSSFDSSNDSIYIKGNLAKRMLDLLRNGGANCHGAAFYCMGLVKDKEWIYSSSFNGVYSNKNAKFTYKNQGYLSIIHLSRKKAHIENYDVFLKTIDHSVIYLGKIGGKNICFEKRGGNHARFSVLESIEDHYKTMHRLYVRLL